MEITNNTIKQVLTLLLIAVIVSIGLFLGSLEQKEDTTPVVVVPDKLTKAYEANDMALGGILDSDNIRKVDKRRVLDQQKAFFDSLKTTCPSNDEKCLVDMLDMRSNDLKKQEKLLYVR